MSRKSVIGQWAVVLIGGMLVSGVASAATIIVKPDGTGTYPTIQMAIDAAGTGDEVVLQPGTYTGDGNRDIYFRGKPITVRSTVPTDPAVVAATVVDCQGSQSASHRGFLFGNGETSQSKLWGLTVTGAGANYSGAISCSSSQPDIRYCVIRDNGTCGVYAYIAADLSITACTISGNRGAGVDCSGSSSGSLRLTRCTITGNGGPGVSQHDRTSVLDGCTIASNHSYGVCMGGGRVTASNTIIACNSGSGISDDYYYSSASSIVSGCTVTNNGGWGISCARGTVSLSNSIVWGNVRGAVLADSTSATYCVVPTVVAGTSNLNVDPGLRPDFHLRSDSPSRNAGDPTFSGGSTDVDGEPRVFGGRVDIGADECVDSDGDGLPDWWELRQFGSATAGSATADPDGDGLTNLQEYDRDTNMLFPARTLHVDPVNGRDTWDGLAATWNGGHGPKATIQAAIDACYNGDDVVLVPGVYRGSGNGAVRYRGRSIRVHSMNPLDWTVVETTILDCEGDGVYFDHAELADACLEGVTITGASGYGVLCVAGSPSIRHCNISGSFGHGVTCRGGAPTFSSCRLTGNSQHGFDLDNSGAVIRNCVIAANAGMGVFSRVDYLAPVPSLVNCTIANNVGAGASGIVTIRNCILWANNGSSDGIWGGPTYVSSDPKLGADYHLQADSPCINAGDLAYESSAGEADFDGEARVRSSRIDVGADEWADSDGDAMPDWWETSWFGSIVAGSASADPDGDAKTNLQEYQRSLNPLLAADACYVDAVAGCEAWDGQMPAWDGRHGPKKTVQCAIDRAFAGWEVVLQPGTYSGLRNRDLDYRGKIITVRGSDPESDSVVAATVIDCQDPSVAERRGFYFHMQETNAAVLAGVTICNGQRASTSGWGGAIYCTGSHPTIRNCVIRNNAGGIWGGGIYCADASPVISGCTITGNTATNGGAIYCQQGNVTIRQCTISGNLAHYGTGGGIACSGGTVLVLGCTITGNSVDSYTGDTAYGAGVYCYQASPTIRQCTISGNTSDTAGGGIYLEETAAAISDCVIKDNSADYYGGAIALANEGQADIRDCLMAGNTSGQLGGAIYFEGATATLTNCTITGNSASLAGGGLAMLWEGAQLPSLRNCILWGDTGGEIEFFFATPAVNYSLVQGGADGTANLNVDPKLTPDGHLQAGSPCINVGDPAYVPVAGETDIDGQGRIVAGRVDMGCDEYRLQGDANGDGYVNVGDLQALVAAWGSSSSGGGTWNANADFNRDGFVNVGDLQLLVANWGR